jgi:putative methyltransferase
MPSTVLLATISSSYQDWIPYPVGCLISHCLKNEKIKKNYKFLEPEYKSKWDRSEFHSKLKQTDILGLTCYVWNQTANDDIAKKFKEYNPDGIVVYGGPNVPEENLDEYKRSYVNYYMTGPGELQWERFLDPDSTSEYAIPTPYTDGIFDNILKQDKNIAVAFETNRGCPYHCSFCDWGGVARSKITKLADEDVQDTIKHILSFDNVQRLEILDANFGIFERDVKIVQEIIEHKKREDMLLTFAGFAKNGSKWLADIMNLTMDNFNDKKRQLKISLQTFTPEVLDTIDRKNISTEKLMSIMHQLENVEVNSELIIGLPGETADTWADTLFKHPEFGISFARAYPLYVLPNTPMAKQDYKDKHKIKTKKIILPSKESFEMIYESKSYDLDEITDIYLTWWYFNTFYNFGIDKTVTKDKMKDFFSSLNDMPFISCCVEEVKLALHRIFKPEKEMILEGYDFLYLHRNLGRGKELLYFKNNIETVQKELGIDFEIHNEDKDLFSTYATIERTKNV